MNREKKVRALVIRAKRALEQPFVGRGGGDDQARLPEASIDQARVDDFREPEIEEIFRHAAR
jgi:hypothetical protein